MEVLAGISFFLGAAWQFFTDIKVPGFDFSFATLFIGSFLVYMGLKWLFMMLGLSVPVSDATRIAELRHVEKSKPRGKLGF